MKFEESEMFSLRFKHQDKGIEPSTQDFLCVNFILKVSSGVDVLLRFNLKILRLFLSDVDGADVRGEKRKRDAEDEGDDDDDE